MILGTIVGVQWYLIGILVPPRPKPDLETPTPRLGQVVATAIHQAVTDPYMAPLEGLARYLSENPDRSDISIQMMTKWAPDDQMPICFTWNADGGGLQLDHPASPWALEEVVSRLRQGMMMENPHGDLYVDTFEAQRERYWLGFLRVPARPSRPRQMIGVVFSIDRYLSEDVPRFIDRLIDRNRFPLFRFQKTSEPLAGETEGDISIRILRGDGEVYFQRGRNFDPRKLIYSESQWYPHPIVCMQRGWDLQVFSTRAAAPDRSDRMRSAGYRLTALMVALVTLFYWWGSWVRRGSLRRESASTEKPVDDEQP